MECSSPSSYSCLPFWHPVNARSASSTAAPSELPSPPLDVRRKSQEQQRVTVKLGDIYKVRSQPFNLSSLQDPSPGPLPALSVWHHVRSDSDSSSSSSSSPSALSSEAFEQVSDLLIPMSVTKKPLGTRLGKKRGWVTFYKRGLISSTSLAQWIGQSRELFCQTIPEGRLSEKVTCKQELSHGRIEEEQRMDADSQNYYYHMSSDNTVASLAAPPKLPPSTGSSCSTLTATPRTATSISSRSSSRSFFGGSPVSPKSTVLHFFMLLHGMSPPGFSNDTTEHWSGLIRRILFDFPSPPCHQDPHILFWAPSYRRETAKSIGSCVSLVLTQLTEELSALLPRFDSIRLYAIGHSLGGVVLRCIFDRNPVMPAAALSALQQESCQKCSKCSSAEPGKATAPVEDLCSRAAADTVLHEDEQGGGCQQSKSSPQACASGCSVCRLCRLYEDFQGLLNSSNLHLDSAVTLCSPHAGAYKTKGFLKVPAKYASYVKWYRGRYTMAMELRNTDRLQLLKTLAEHEMRGESWLMRKASSFACAAHGPPDTVPISQHEVSSAATTDEVAGPPKRFHRVLFYGVLLSDWFVSAESALATACKVEESDAARMAIRDPMTPYRFVPELDQAVAQAIVVVERRRKEQVKVAQQILLTLECCTDLERYLVSMPRDSGLSATSPHGAIKGSPSIVTSANEKIVWNKAEKTLIHISKEILRHVDRQA
eukprot:GHVS01097784.1.p1 GENE.GHVS01097784.1~~GHVS01097784.1.p1  ORF type:complete len:710 (+),score=92.38 GHVS01097784.1:134-2263(+)